MAFCGRGSGPLTPICNTNRLTVPRNMSTKFHKDISIFTQVRACTGGRTDSYPDFNSSLHPDHLYLNIYKSRVTMFALNGLLNHLTDYNKIRTPCAVRSNLRDRIV